MHILRDSFCSNNKLMSAQCGKLSSILFQKALSFNSISQSFFPYLDLAPENMCTTGFPISNCDVILLYVHFLTHLFTDTISELSTHIIRHTGLTLTGSHLIYAGYASKECCVIRKLLQSFLVCIDSCDWLIESDITSSQ